MSTSITPKPSAVLKDSKPKTAAKDSAPNKTANTTPSLKLTMETFDALVTNLFIHLPTPAAPPPQQPQQQQANGTPTSTTARPPRQGQKALVLGAAAVSAKLYAAGAPGIAAMLQADVTDKDNDFVNTKLVPWLAKHPLQRLPHQIDRGIYLHTVAEAEARRKAQAASRAASARHQQNETSTSAHGALFNAFRSGVTSLFSSSRHDPHPQTTTTTTTTAPTSTPGEGTAAAAAAVPRLVTVAAALQDIPVTLDSVPWKELSVSGRIGDIGGTSGMVLWLSAQMVFEKHVQQYTKGALERLLQALSSSSPSSYLAAAKKPGSTGGGSTTKTSHQHVDPTATSNTSASPASTTAVSEAGADVPNADAVVIEGLVAMLQLLRRAASVASKGALGHLLPSVEVAHRGLVGASARPADLGRTTSAAAWAGTASPRHAAAILKGQPMDPSVSSTADGSVGWTSHRAASTTATAGGKQPPPPFVSLWDPSLSLQDMAEAAWVRALLENLASPLVAALEHCVATIVSAGFDEGARAIRQLLPEDGSKVDKDKDHDEKAASTTAAASTAIFVEHLLPVLCRWGRPWLLEAVRRTVAANIDKAVEHWRRHAAGPPHRSTAIAMGVPTREADRRAVTAYVAIASGCHALLAPTPTAAPSVSAAAAAVLQQTPLGSSVCLHVLARYKGVLASAMPGTNTYISDFGTAIAEEVQRKAQDLLVGPLARQALCAAMRAELFGLHSAAEKPPPPPALPFTPLLAALALAELVEGGPSTSLSSQSPSPPSVVDEEGEASAPDTASFEGTLCEASADVFAEMLLDTIHKVPNGQAHVRALKSRLHWAATEGMWRWQHDPHHKQTHGQATAPTASAAASPAVGLDACVTAVLESPQALRAFLASDAAEPTARCLPNRLLLALGVCAVMAAGTAQFHTKKFPTLLAAVRVLRPQSREAFIGAVRRGITATLQPFAEGFLRAILCHTAERASAVSEPLDPQTLEGSRMEDLLQSLVTHRMMQPDRGTDDNDAALAELRATMTAGDLVWQRAVQLLNPLLPAQEPTASRLAGYITTQLCQNVKIADGALDHRSAATIVNIRELFSVFTAEGSQYAGWLDAVKDVQRTATAIEGPSKQLSALLARVSDASHFSATDLAAAELRQAASASAKCATVVTLPAYKLPVCDAFTVRMVQQHAGFGGVLRQVEAVARRSGDWKTRDIRWDYARFSVTLRTKVVPGGAAGQQRAGGVAEYVMPVLLAAVLTRLDGAAGENGAIDWRAALAVTTEEEGEAAAAIVSLLGANLIAAAPAAHRDPTDPASVAAAATSSTAHVPQRVIICPPVKATQRPIVITLKALDDRAVQRQLDQQLKVERENDASRQRLFLEVTVVRLMKGWGTAGYQQLMQALADAALKHGYRGEFRQLAKEVIEKLIKNNFLKRDQRDAEQLVYIA